MVGVCGADNARGWLAFLKCINLAGLICISRSRFCDLLGVPK
jgi:hypothetical protein